MSRPLEVMRFALLAVCLSGAACIPFEEDRTEFCKNVDPRLKDELCPPLSDTDGGVRSDAGLPGDAGEPDAGSEDDAGTDGGAAGACDTAADCPAVTAQCQDLRVCINHQCEYRQQEDGAPCSGTPAAECLETTGTCRSGVCQYTPRATGPCNDAQPCTVNDACNSAGVCAGTLLNCNSPPPCMKFAGICRDGQCNYVPAAAGTTCDDGNACTMNEACDGSGNCLSEQVVDCKDNPDTCEETTGCDPVYGCLYRSTCPNTQVCQNGGCCVPFVNHCVE